MTREEMLRHAEAWIAAWNRRDLGAVLSSFAENACFTSPQADRIKGRATVEGKPALAAYWREALARRGRMRFELVRVACDEAAREMVVVYVRTSGRKRVRACEFMRFDANGCQIEGEAMYGAEVPLLDVPPAQDWRWLTYFKRP